ncbi:Na+/H+ antiporter NhaA [Pseudomonadales bacterium]|nr:Na+/H+ antiporter NhaA [Pseudomonadales bacterium]MDA9297602.1 Na+/H+ antiporter NhaA [Pseudomonadales bacterium]MDB4069211.1 Na+/H+ antiporter NhaA [Pseudomonadales bacterium]MDB4149889.1 Na+/H+ antiporter NhaA [Pseudomonadales bacterium]MDB9868016.1 Na+/H+ antiporter NhaA [Pseudomonadales bacterium]
MITETVITRFLRLEASSGILLLIAAALAMLAENSFASAYYEALLDLPVQIRIGDFEIAKPLLLWINDGLMAIFFFLIGLEVKREVLHGELSDPARVVLPIVGAAGGMMIPALIYAWVNWGNPVAMNGWAIPSATDIAFALAVLALVGSNVPASLKLFLMALAIADDLGAIIIIALFYTSQLSVLSLLVAALAVLGLFVLNRRGVLSLVPYLLVGLVLWVAVLKSGVHATLAGVLVAMFIPYRKAPGQELTQLERLEDDLHPAVVYGILPLFAFANTGISFAGLTLQSLLEPVPLGIALGLFLGNQVGVMGFCWVAIKLGLARLPSGANWLHMYGISCLCGIGFTMSLFISSLAFEASGSGTMINDRLGILVGSMAAALLGFVVLKLAGRPVAAATPVTG